MKLSNDNEKGLENAKHFRKKLLIATDNFFPRWDGISRFLSEIIPELKKKYKITVICPDFGDVKIEDVEIIKIPLFKFKIGDYAPAKFKPKIIKKYVKKNDIIFTQSIGPIGISAIKYGKKYKKPVINYIHSLEWELVTKSTGLKGLREIIIYNFIKLVSWFYYNKSTILITPSLEIAEILSWQKIKTNKLVVHMGIDVNKFTPKNKAEAKRKINISPEKKVIGFVGRLGKEKDLKTLYRAFIRCKKKNKNIILLIVGEGVKELENLFKNKEDIIFVGSTKNVVDYYQAMDIYVLPSLTETSSLTTMEAMACEVAVICTPVGYIKEYVKDKINGLFFQRQNSYALQKKIELILEDDKLRNKLSINARKTIIKRFSFEKTVEGIKKVLEMY